jgi:hypothetical protein
VFIPNTPFYEYYVNVAVIGQTVSDTYLESYLANNGTEWIVERQLFSVGNLVPFVLTEGRAYGFMFTCDQGTVDFGTQVIGDPSQVIQLMVSPQNFPSSASTFGNITVAATRMNSTWIQALYNDSGGGTSNVNTTISLSGYTELASTAVSNTSSVNWFSADPTQDYLVTITSQTTSGVFTWTNPVSHPISSGNPFSGMNSLGPTLPFKVTDLFGFIVILLIFSTGSAKDSHMILLLSIVIAALLTIIGWLSISSTTLMACFCLGILWAFSKRRNG